MTELNKLIHKCEIAKGTDKVVPAQQVADYLESNKIEESQVQQISEVLGEMFYNQEMVDMAALFIANAIGYLGPNADYALDDLLHEVKHGARFSAPAALSAIEKIVTEKNYQEVMTKLQKIKPNKAEMVMKIQEAVNRLESKYS